MSTKKKGKLSSKMVKRFKDWESRMLQSKNDLERYVIVDEMRQACESEVTFWNNLMDVSSGLPRNEFVKIASEAQIHISNMNSMLERIKESLDEFSDGAIAILKAMRNEGKAIPQVSGLMDKF